MLSAAFMAASLFCAASSAAPLEATSAVKPHATPPELWYGIFLQDMPIGGDHESTSTVQFEGRRCKLTTSVSRTALTVLGQTVGQEVSSRDWQDDATGKPIYEDVVMTSSGVTTEVTARFSDKQVVAVLDSGGRKETHTLTIPAGTVLMADDPTMAATSVLYSGKKLVYFNPETLAIEPISVAPAAGEPKSNPHKMIVSMSMGSATITTDSDGIPIRMDLPVGLSMVRGTAEDVTRYMAGEHSVSTQAGSGDIEQAAPDFAVVTSVVPTGEPLLPHPAFLMADVTVGKAPAKMHTMKAVPVPTPDQATGTLASIRGRADLAPTLGNTAYLALDSPEIAKQASEIAQSRTNLYDIAVHIEQWVHQDMTATPAVGLPRSSVEILHDRQGVCRDYALLYTALARKAGVPTRLCAGLVGYKGRFYYHAWAESYIGDPIGWLPVDPTLFQHPVDASHIALVKGEPVAIYDLVGKIGDIKVNILQCSQ